MDILTFKDIIVTFIPEFETCIGFNQNNPYHNYDVFEHTYVALKESDPSTDQVTKLAILFHDIAKPDCMTIDEKGVSHFYGHSTKSAEMTEQILHRIPIAEHMKSDIVQLVKYHDTILDDNDKCIKRWINKIGIVQMRRLFMIKRADIKAQSQLRLEERLSHINKLEERMNRIFDERRI